MDGITGSKDYKSLTDYRKLVTSVMGSSQITTARCKKKQKSFGKQECCEWLDRNG